MLAEDLEDDLGKVVFSPNRTDDVPKDEPNTYMEDMVFRNLRAWIRDYEPINKESIAILTAALDDPKYNDYIRRAPPEDVFRGMATSKSLLAKWLGMDPATMPPKGQSDTDYVLKPGGRFGGMIKPLSFSRSADTAKAFAETAKHNVNPTSQEYSSVIYVLWQADTVYGGNEFIDVEWMQMRTSKLSPGGSESEVLSFKPVKCTNVWWWSEEEVEGGIYK